MKSLANEFFLTMENGAKEHQRLHAAEYDLVTNGIKDEIDPAVLKSKKLNVPFVGPDNRLGARLVGDYLAKSLKPGDPADDRGWSRRGRGG